VFRLAAMAQALAAKQHPAVKDATKTNLSPGDAMEAPQKAAEIPKKVLASPDSAASAKRPIRPSALSSADEVLEASLAKLNMTETTVAGALEKFAGIQPDKKVYWTQSIRFNAVVGSVVSVNAILIGLEADFADKLPMLFFVFEHFFTTVFTIELILHMVVEGPFVYFADTMNWLDFTLVMVSIVDVWILGLLMTGSGVNMKAISALRVLRLLRLARLLRLFRMFKELTLIVCGFVASLKTLFWAFIFLLIIVYSCAIFVRQVVGNADDCDEWVGLPRECTADNRPYYIFNPEIGDQRILFGRVDNSMLTLFICLTEGCGMEVIRPIVLKTPLMVFFWIGFVLITTFGLLNIIVGIFCENAMKTAGENEKEILSSKEEWRRDCLKSIIEAFMQQDDGSNIVIKADQYKKCLQTDIKVVKLMADLGLDKEDHLFKLLDCERKGELSFEQFFDGAMLIIKGQESAKAKDMVGTHLLCQAIAGHIENSTAEQNSIMEAQKQMENETFMTRRACEESSLIAQKVDKNLTELTKDIAEIRRALLSSIAPNNTDGAIPDAVFGCAASVSVGGTSPIILGAQPRGPIQL